MSSKNVIKQKPKERKPKFVKLKKMFGFKIPDSAKTALDAPKDIFSGDIIEKQDSTTLINLLIWFTLLGFLYITNNYRAEEKIRTINKKEKALKEMRYHYISTKSKLMTMSRQSEVLKRLETKGFKENKEPLKVIKITKTDLQSMKK